MNADRRDRLRGMIIGQFTGDALCLGSHWYYDFARREAAYPGGIEGFERPQAGHYHEGREPGEFTHLGDAALILLRSVAQSGKLDPLDYGQRFVDHFGDPAIPGYRDRPTRITLEHWHAWKHDHPDGTAAEYGFRHGADDAQTITAARLAPVTAAHLDDDDYAARVETATRVCQNNDEAVRYSLLHAHILKSLSEGAGFEQAVQDALAALDHSGNGDATITALWSTARALRGQDVMDATGEFGRACYLKSAMPAAMHAALVHEDDPRAALIACMRAGGDNASRCAVLGAWLGARHGSALFEAWWQRLAHKVEIEALSARILGER